MKMVLIKFVVDDWAEARLNLVRRQCLDSMMTIDEDLILGGPCIESRADLDRWVGGGALELS